MSMYIVMAYTRLPKDKRKQRDTCEWVVEADSPEDAVRRVRDERVAWRDKFDGWRAFQTGFLTIGHCSVQRAFVLPDTHWVIPMPPEEFDP